MKRDLLSLLTVAGALALTACSDDVGPRTGVLALKLTDAPFSADSVARADMFVVRIDGRVADASDAEAGSTDDPEGNSNPSAGWVALATPNQSINLLDLQNGTATNLGQAVLPTGDYRGFRLILDTDRSSITLKDGTVLTGASSPSIQWPSAGQTGIKIDLDRPIHLVESGTVMVIDFDLGSSFVLRGSTIESNGLLFTPVIRAVGYAGVASAPSTSFVR